MEPVPSSAAPPTACLAPMWLRGTAPRFGPSGWELVWNTTGVTQGVHQLYLYAHRTADNTWSQMPPHLVVVSADHGFWLPLVIRS